MRRQSTNHLFMSVISWFQIISQLCIYPGGGDALPGFQDGETVT